MGSASENKTISTFLDVTIDRPAQAVWPYLFRKNTDVWTRTAYTTVAGEAGQVGEAYEMPFQGGQLAFEAVTVTPEKHLVLRITFRERDSQDRKLCGYDLFTLKEHSGRTTVVFQQAVELPGEVGEDLTERAEKHSQFLGEIFQDLKRMVEGSPLSGAAEETWWRK